MSLKRLRLPGRFRRCVLPFVFGSACDDTDRACDAAVGDAAVDDAAVSGDAAASDQGPDANRGAACQTAAYAKCDRLLTCNLTFTDIDICAEQFVQRCCGDASTCDDALSVEAAAQVPQCIRALRMQACEGAASTPADCMDLSAAL